jgi:hypothetical protein
MKVVRISIIQITTLGGHGERKLLTIRTAFRREISGSDVPIVIWRDLVRL